MSNWIMVYVSGWKFSVDSSAIRHAHVATGCARLAGRACKPDFPARIANTQVIDSAEQKVVNDVSFGSKVRILATTLPQFNKTTIATTAVEISSPDSAF
jgi:hypothetical protein